MADGAADVCVCVLFYGTDDYCYSLAQRVLNRPMRQLADLGAEFRFGLNAVGAPTRELVMSFAEKTGAAITESSVNIYKYPIMRRMFYEKQLHASATMWFDDNSFISPDADAARWLQRVLNQLSSCTMLGSVYTQGLVGKQPEWVRNQPWFAGKEPGPYVKYAAGGWWTIQTEALRRLDWPTKNVKHHGGDVMLGEALKQQDMLLCHFRDDVMIQANANGLESAQKRRGFDAAPVGFDYAT
jgi:hypothetical protein